MILMVRRAARFSPNSVEKDTAISESLCQKLRRYGFDVETISEDELTPDVKADVYISMGRSETANNILRQLHDAGSTVIAPSMSKCLNAQNILTDRRFLEAALISEGMPVLSGESFNGYWIKRNNGYTETEDDVVFAADNADRDIKVAQMSERVGVDNVYVTPHIIGDLVKFYGVEGTDFFETYYPGDDGCTKFSQEQQNGKPQHYCFDKEVLWRKLDAIAHYNKVEFYGGDCIVDQNGQVYVVDFNDWPSFSRCRDRAAHAMAMAVMRIIANSKKRTAQLNNVRAPKGYIFDYGGTLDTGGQHWGKVIWHAYQDQGVPVDEQLYRDAYVHGERTLGKNPIIKPDFTFHQTLSVKLQLQLDYIAGKQPGFDQKQWHAALLDRLYAQTEIHTRRSAWYLRRKKSADNAKMVLVSNFYGNVNTVLHEFGFDGLFDSVIESAVVGVRKPDPRIFTIGVEALGLKPDEVVVIGDSYDKDIIPAVKAGCHAVWFIGEGWTDEMPDGAEADKVITGIHGLFYDDRQKTGGKPDKSE